MAVWGVYVPVKSRYPMQLGGNLKSRGLRYDGEIQGPHCEIAGREAVDDVLRD